jgi:hypothetical protein
MLLITIIFNTLNTSHYDHVLFRLYFVRIKTFPSVYLTICLSVYLSICLSVCLSHVPARLRSCCYNTQEFGHQRFCLYRTCSMVCGVDAFWSDILAIFSVSSQLIVFWYLPFPAILCYFYQISLGTLCILRPLYILLLIFAISNSSPTSPSVLQAIIPYPLNAINYYTDIFHFHLYHYTASFFILLLLSVIVFLPAEFLLFVLLLTPFCWIHKHKGTGMTATV